MVNGNTSIPSETSGGWVKQTDPKVGGKNLLREYDLRFDSKYWGNHTLVEGQNYVEVDIDAVIQVLKYLNVHPKAIAWVYQEHESNVVVKSNVDWNIN